MIIDKIDFNKIKTSIVKAVTPDAIYIFGSYAHGKPDKNSDLDICVIKKGIRSQNIELKYYSIIRDRLEYLDKAFDILIFNKGKFEKRKDIKNSIQYEIHHKGLKLYEKVT